MKKILFFIPNLMHGGAEKVLINLVNNMDKNKFDITVQTIFDVGVNKQYLNPDIKYKYCFKKLFRGSTTFFKLFSPEFLFRCFIKEEYNIVVSYLEGPTARILSGCPNTNTKKVAWIHIELPTDKSKSLGFRSLSEAKRCYGEFDKIVHVSKTVKDEFLSYFPFKQKSMVLFNTVETDKICSLSNEDVDDVKFDGITVCSAGKLTATKGFDRLAKAHKRIIDEGILHKVYILGVGEQEQALRQYLAENNLSETFILLGYRDNPYKYVSKCDLYVCSSFKEGFSTSATEALIVGTPVLTTLCSGMTEMLGENNEYGVIVENSENGLYEGLKKLLTDKELLAHYKKMAEVRGKFFSTENTVNAVEEMLENL